MEATNKRCRKKRVGTAERKWKQRTTEGRETKAEMDRLFLGCLMSQQHASVYLGQICLGNCMCYHPEIEVAD